MIKCDYLGQKIIPANFSIFVFIFTQRQLKVSRINHYDNKIVIIGTYVIFDINQHNKIST